MPLFLRTLFIRARIHIQIHVWCFHIVRIRTPLYVWVCIHAFHADSMEKMVKNCIQIFLLCRRLSFFCVISTEKKTTKSVVKMPFCWRQAFSGEYPEHTICAINSITVAHTHKHTREQTCYTLSTTRTKKRQQNMSKAVSVCVHVCMGIEELLDTLCSVILVCVCAVYSSKYFSWKH